MTTSIETIITSDIASEDHPTEWYENNSGSQVPEEWGLPYLNE